MYATLEEADRAAREAQWLSEHFDYDRDIPLGPFLERMEICKKCNQLNSMNICEQCMCFMPTKARIGMAECPIKKWVTIGRELPPSPIVE